MHTGLNLPKVSALQLYKHFKLDDNTISFCGHACALHLNDEYVRESERTSEHLHYEGETERGSEREILFVFMHGVCVCVRERERETHTHTHTRR